MLPSTALCLMMVVRLLRPLLENLRSHVASGEAEVQIQQWRSYKRSFSIEARKASTIAIRTYYYPAWHLYVNRQSYPIDVSDEGTIQLSLEPGSHTVELYYQWTPSFKTGLAIGFLSLSTLVFYWIRIS